MESSFVAKLISSLPPDIRLEVPVGDDAAVVRPPAMRRTVITVDMLMEGTDFLPFPATDPKAVGYKALAVNLSDLAAMGASRGGSRGGRSANKTWENNRR